MKKSNAYADELTPKMYADVPKAVLAAIAVSPYFNSGSDDTNIRSADAFIAREWAALHSNGIIPQPLPARWRNLLPRPKKDAFEW